MTSKILDLQEFTTPENCSVWLSYSKIPVVSFGLTFLGSGFRSSKDQPALLELLSGLLDEGAGPYNRQTFKRKLLEKNIQLFMGADLDNFTFTFRVPKKNIKDAFEVLGFILSSPRFEEEDMERVKKQIKSGWEQSLHFPKTVAYEAFQKFFLGKDHPYNPRTLEKIKDIQTLTTHDLRTYMGRHFSQENLRAVAVGDISSEELSLLLDPIFSKIKKSSSQVTHESTLPQNLGQTLKVNMPVPQTVIYFGQPSINIKDSDFYALYIVNRILGSNFESRLWHEVREKRGLAYFCSTNLSNKDLSNVLLGVTATKTETVDETIDILKKEWKRLADFGITEEELNFHKKNTIGSYALGFNSSLSIVSILLLYRQLNFNIQDINSRNQKIQNLEIQNVNDAIKRYIKPSELTFVVVGK